MRKLIYILAFLFAFQGFALTENDTLTKQTVSRSFIEQIEPQPIFRGNLEIIGETFVPDGYLQLPVITLSGPKKAFPSAHGFAAYIRGGWDSGNIIEVTNLNNSGTGSFRDAVENNSDAIILIKVSGVCNITSDIENNFTNDNLTIIGQTSVGDGFTITGAAVILRGNNTICRGFSIRPIAGSAGNDDSLFFLDNGGRQLNVYVDRMSLSFGADEVLSARSNSAASLMTSTWNLMGQCHQDHNRGGIFGTIRDSGTPSGDPGDIINDGGHYTQTYCWYQDIAARFPNGTGTSVEIGNYNNVVSNWGKGRLNRTNADVTYDWYNNYHYKGNESGTVSINVLNKHQVDGTYGGQSNVGAGARFFAQQNYIEGFEETPDNDDSDCYQHFLTSSVGSGGGSNTQLQSQYFVTSRQSNALLPDVGILPVLDVPAYVSARVGNCYRTNNLGEPTFNRDDLDSEYISDTFNGTTVSTYKTQAQFALPTINTNLTSYPDNTVAHIPDAWASKHNLTSTFQVKSQYIFDDYVVDNQAGYTALEIFTEYVVDGFGVMSTDGTIVVPDPEPTRSRGQKAKTARLKSMEP